MKKLLATMGVLFTLCYSPNASAVVYICPGCLEAINASKAAIDAGKTSIVGAINAANNAIVSAISGQTQTLATQEARAAEMVVQGNQKTQATLETGRQDDRYMVSDACAVLAPTLGAAEAGRKNGGRGGGRGGSAPQTKGLTEDMKKAVEISAGARPAPSPEEQAALAVPGACSSFVSETSNPVRANSCDMAGFKAGLSNGHPDADIRAETLFDGPQKSREATDFRRRLTLDGDGNEDAAVQAYLRNLNTPIDLRQLTKTELRSNNGRQYMLYRDAYEARMSLAEKPARSLVASMVADKSLLPVVEQLVKSDITGPFVRSYLDKNYPSWKSKGISHAELMNLEVERTYRNPDWRLLMASSPPEVHVKEQTAMLALNSYLMARVLERLDQNAVLAGQQVATQVRGEMMPQLIQLHRSAGR